MAGDDVPTLTFPEWGPALSVGDDEIDAEHRALLDHFGRVATLVETGGAAEIKAEAAAMVAMLKSHFETEERIFGRTAYPKARAHAVEHWILLRMAAYIKTLIDESDDTLRLRLSLRYLARDMVEHLMNTDMGYRAYLASSS